MAKGGCIEKVKKELAAAMVEHQILHDRMNDIRRLVYEINKKVAHLESELAELEADETPSGE